MRISTIKKMLVMGLLAFLFITFSACDLATGGLQVEDIASRSLGDPATSVVRGKAPVAMKATVDLYQDLTSVVTRTMGSSDHYKTVQETLYSKQYGPIVSDWELLHNKNVIMTNTTNYNLDPVSGEISGSNHSVIHVVDELDNSVLTLEANGVLDGSILGAEIEMNWVVKESYGANIHARGKITGLFTWAIFNPATMGIEYVLPHGTFNLTGTFN